MISASHLIAYRCSYLLRRWMGMPAMRINSGPQARSTAAFAVAFPFRTDPESKAFHLPDSNFTC